jgi:hypothetical protein
MPVTAMFVCPSFNVVAEELRTREWEGRTTPTRRRGEGGGLTAVGGTQPKLGLAARAVAQSLAARSWSTWSTVTVTRTASRVTPAPEASSAAACIVAFTSSCVMGVGNAATSPGLVQRGLDLRSRTSAAMAESTGRYSSATRLRATACQGPRTGARTVS